MKNSAEKSAIAVTNAEFPWSDDELALVGIGRQEAHMAWLVLYGVSPELAKTVAGYESDISVSQITSVPRYVHAMRVLSAQYLNAVVLPEAIRNLQAIANDTTAPPAARVQAAGRLIDHATASWERIRDEQRKGASDIDIDELTRVIERLEADRAATAKVVQPVQKRGETQVDDAYLSDMIG